MADWARQALERLARGEPCALVTLLAVEGSAPREAGCKMVVWNDGQAGMIGGGNLEFQATEQARRMLARGEAVRFAIQDYPLGPLLAQCCGGRVRLMIERLEAGDAAWLAQAADSLDAGRPFEIRTRFSASAVAKSVTPAAVRSADAPALTLNSEATKARGPLPSPGDLLIDRSEPVRARVLLFGAGHVGQALAKVLATLPFHLDWFDSRADLEPIRGLRVTAPHALAEAARQAGEAYVLVLTHDHALDYALVSAALAGGGPGYLGLIGSKTKRARFLSRLRADGHSETALTRLVCPIGLPDLKGKAPEIIAVSVAADLLLRREAALQPPVREYALASL